MIDPQISAGVLSPATVKQVSEKITAHGRSAFRVAKDDAAALQPPRRASGKGRPKSLFPSRKQVTKKTAAKVALSAFLIFLMILIILSPARYAKACADGIALWAKAVLPTLFPFLILTAILTKLGAAETLTRRAAPLSGKHKIPPATAYCFFMSILSGYPVGSRIVADLAKNGEIGEKEAARIGAVCSTSGPMFLIGSVGGTMFGDAKAGAILFASHLLGVLLVCLVFLPFLKPLPTTPHRQTEKTADNLLSESVHGAVVSILCVGGFIAAFYVLFLALSDMRLLTPVSNFLSLFFPEQVAEGICAGLLEATQGCARLASAESIFALPAAAFCTTFGGASILAQQLSFLQGAGVKTAPFIGIKALQGIASFLLCLGLSALFC